MAIPLDRLASASAASNAWRSLSLNNVVETLAVMADGPIFLQEGSGTTAPSGTTNALRFPGNVLIEVSVPANRNVWIRGSGASRNFSAVAIRRVPAPVGPLTFAATRKAAGQATVAWTLPDYGTRATGLTLRYRRRNQTDTGWGNWSSVSINNTVFAAGTVDVTGLTTSARRYQFEAVFTAAAGNSLPSYAEVTVNA